MALMASNSGVRNVSTLLTANVYIVSNRYPEGASDCQYDTINFGASDLTLILVRQIADLTLLIF